MLRFVPTNGIIAFLLVCLCVPVAQGQGLDVRRTAEDATGVTFEVRISWPSSLSAALDSARSRTLTLPLAGRLTGQLFEVSESLRLPALNPPSVQLLSSDYDEVPLAAASDSVIAALSGPVVRAVGTGMERRHPATTLQVRTLVYDASRGMLRRYRTVVVRVNYAGGTAARTVRAAGRQEPVTRSVLADGIVFKIPITQEGVYRIDRATLASWLEQAGAGTGTIAADAVRLYGNGGEPLPALNSAARPQDLLENPVWVRSEGTAFSELYFYGEPPNGWRYDAETSRWRHYVNPFSTENYYFLKYDPSATGGLRLTDVSYPAWTDAPQVTVVTGRHFVEPDQINWARDAQGGLTWVSRLISPGERLDVLSGAPAGFNGGQLQYHARVAIRSNPVVPVRFVSGSSVLAEVTANPVSSRSDAPIANPAESVFSQQVTAGTVPVLSMTIQNGSNNPEAALDWLRVTYPQVLTARNGFLRFSTVAGTGGRFTYVLAGFEQEPQVWDVTEPGAIRRLGVQGGGGQYLVQVETMAGTPREILAFTPTALQAVKTAKHVAPQNLHGIQGYPHLVIVAPDTFRVYAEELAAIRRAEGMAVEIVDPLKIYNEFSGGLQDMRAVRDYLKFLYDRAPDDASLLQYTLLLGDGHFDYRRITAPPNRNWVLPFQSDETLDPERSYTSDDYFGLLDDAEGQWPFNFTESVSSERVDIGIGRLTAQTTADVRAMIDKIKGYADPATYGAWRSRYLFVADDEYNGRAHINVDDDLHVQNAEATVQEVERRGPAMNIQKVYLMGYEPVYRTEWRVPEAKRDILEALNEGVLLFNYTGHGNEHALTQEEVFTREDAAELDNGRTPGIFVIATCSFGRWDMTNDVSGAEALLDNGRGGAVASFSTVRTVYTSANVNSLNVGLNRALNVEFFRREASGLPRRLGDIMRATKNTSVGLQSNSRKFGLLGDPTMRIGLPEGQTAVNTLNGKPVTDSAAVISAMERVTIEGEVRTVAGTVDTGFDGRATLTVYDSRRAVPIRAPRYLSSYDLRDGLIWRGDVPVQAGRYTATFVVPRDISYSGKPGRISVYATSGQAQALGYDESVEVGGTATSAPDDSRGPEIAIFLNDSTFVEGGLSTPVPDVLIRLEDASGVNTVGAGVGHELLLVLDGREEDAIDVGRFYQNDEGSYQRGTVRYPLEEYLRSTEDQVLAPGPHTLKVKAWDVLNNVSEAETSFYVTASEALTVRNLLNYPNPMSGPTRFVFEHNQPSGTPAKVQLRIYSLAGRPIRTIESDEALPTGVLPAGIVQIPWDGRDDDFDQLGTGVYLYRLRIEVDSVEGERQVCERIEKLAVIR